MYKKGLSGSTIKIIAMLTMVVDHVGTIILENGFAMTAPYHYFTNQQFSHLLAAIQVCNIIGSLAFPLFCFLLVEGFYHTKNIKKYCLNLGLFALFTEPLYDWALSGHLIDWNGQNVFFTLFLGLMTLVGIRKFNNHPFLTLVITTCSASFAYLLHLDGWYYGILLIVCFYLFRDSKWLKYLLPAIIMFICGLDFSFRALVSPYFLVTLGSLVIIANYNGKRGLSLKYFFYFFYPLHLVLLKFLANILTSGF